MVQRRIILGIVGDSAAGKTTLTRGIAQILGEDRVTVICTDDYHRYNRKQRAELGITALDPGCNYLDIMQQHLTQLRTGQPILKPIYNHNTGDFDPPEYIKPCQFVIVEGLLGYSTRGARDAYDVKVYLAPPEELRRKWKIKRDMRKRGYTEDQVVAALDKREPDSEQFIRPQRQWADLVVSFYPPQARSEETGGHLNVRLVLRPTIQHPDLVSLFDIESSSHAAPDSSMRLGLDRDMGKPVDVLEIDGDATREEVLRMEHTLCSEVPDLASVCSIDSSEVDIGQVVGTTGETLQSYPLALTQLLITYHMLKASSLFQ
ncbi:uridine kinase [Rubidibacter lacunae KORDI 51-2]|uniref:phosphoribulokinase n=1 Tax=Rubidibacter lacunae KORDI 51-2 TaxID=582515 RepID=U5DQB1_9CHRO|nr:phosphoribulokinase [Rubidibacter lacunae]ERN42804.1 uridine kinase [Rubidibacter lacunae KORDI 51-2]